MILDQHPQASTDTEIQAALHRLGDRIEAMGAYVERRNDLLPKLTEAHKCFSNIVAAVKSRHGSFSANPMSAHEWMKVMDAQVAVRRYWADFFSSFDVVLAPAFGTAAFRHDDTTDRRDRTLCINGQETPYGAQSAWSSTASAAHLPSTVAPIDRTVSGLPIGIQIIGPYLEDRTTIGFAGLLEREFVAAQAPGD